MEERTQKAAAPSNGVVFAEIEVLCAGFLRLGLIACSRLFSLPLNGMTEALSLCLTKQELVSAGVTEYKVQRCQHIYVCVQDTRAGGMDRGSGVGKAYPRRIASRS